MSHSFEFGQDWLIRLTRVCVASALAGLFLFWGWHLLFLAKYLYYLQSIFHGTGLTPNEPMITEIEAILSLSAGVALAAFAGVLATNREIYRRLFRS
ncbi:MAG: hypothetical protein QW767_05400 [Thermoprotei archaeon]